MAAKICLEKDDLLELYKDSVATYLHLNEVTMRRRAWFVAILSALTAATGAGFFQAKTLPHFIVLLLGPAMIFAIAHIGTKAWARDYRAFLEGVSYMLKYQQLLGLHKLPCCPADSKDKDAYWHGEPIMAPRHLECRETASSEQWIEEQKNRRWSATTITGGLYSLTKVLAILLFGAIAFQAAQLVKPTHAALALQLQGKVFPPHLPGIALFAVMAMSLAIIFLHLKYKRPAIVQDRKNRIARAAEDCGKALGRKRAWKEAGGENKGNDIETAIALYNNSPACSKLSRHEYALVRRAAGLHQDGEFEPYRWWLDVIAGVVLMAGLIYYAIWLLFM